MCIFIHKKPIHFFQKIRKKETEWVLQISYIRHLHNKIHQARSITATPGERRSKMSIQKTLKNN